VRRGQRKGEQLDPIARWEPAGDDGQVLLMDTRAMTIHLTCDARTVRRYEPVACDVDTRAPLWDAFAVGAARATIRTRAARSVRATRAAGLRAAT
jgi:hypothetical protein